MDEGEGERLRCLFCEASFDDPDELYVHAAKEHFSGPDLLWLS